MPLSRICLLCILSSCGVLTLCVGQFCHYLFISTNSEWSYTNVFVGLCMSFYASLTVLYRGWWMQLVEWAHLCWGGIDWFALWLRVTYWGANCCSSWRKLQTQHLYNGQCSKVTSSNPCTVHVLNSCFLVRRILKPSPKEMCLKCCYSWFLSSGCGSAVLSSQNNTQHKCS